MDKQKIAEELDKALGGTTVKIIAPRFLSFVENILGEQYEKLIDLVNKKQMVGVGELLKEFKELKELTGKLAKAVEQSRVESVEVKNFPAQEKMPEFPTSMDFKMPDWLEDAVLNKIQDYIKSGFDQAKFSQELLSKGFEISSDETIVPGVAGKRIYVYAAKQVMKEKAETNWKDGLKDLEGAQEYVENGGYTESVNPPLYLFRTSLGDSLNLATTGVTAGRVSYWIE